MSWIARYSTLVHYTTDIRGDAANLADSPRCVLRFSGNTAWHDILFAKACIGECAPLCKMLAHRFARQFGLNVRGLLFTVQKNMP
jgi:hypothetical protein